MRLIPEYEPVQKLCLCFVHDFFNTRFKYGKAICQIIQAAQSYVEIELWIGPTEIPYFDSELRQILVSLEHVTLNPDTPGRVIIAEYVPIFAREENCASVGLVFQNPFLDQAAELKQFSERLTKRLGFQLLDMGFSLATAHLLVNEDVVLLSDSLFKGDDREAKLDYFTQNFPSQSFHLVSPLAGDITDDLDMYLWPIASKAWIVSEYPEHTPPGGFHRTGIACAPGT